MFVINDNLRKMKKKAPPILGLSYRGLPNGTENNQNIANQIINNSGIPQKRPSNGSTPGDPGGILQGSDSILPKQIAISQNGDAQSETESQSSTNYPSQLPKISNPLYGVNAAQQYLPNSTHTNSTTGFNGYSNGNKKGADQLEKQLDMQKINGVRKAPEGQDNESYLHEDEHNSRELILSTNPIEGQTETSAATHYTTDTNGKINVHVTVMIGFPPKNEEAPNTPVVARTLADLKKQRAQNRNSSPAESSLTGNDSVAGSLPPSLPQMDVPRFSGNTSEVVGDARSRRCCVIM